MQNDSHRHRRAALYILLLLGTILRGVNFPSRYEQRDSDETGYLQSGLLVLEGIQPPFKAAPAGPQIWLGWGFAAAKTAGYLFAPTAEERTTPPLIRPYVALNHALFELYRDGGTMREFEIAFISILSIASIVSAFELGRFFAGMSGAILVGGLCATLPLFVSLAGQSRPYSLAWSFGFFALWFAVRPASRGRFVLSSTLFGLSIASRVEMLCLFPFFAILLVNEVKIGMRRSLILKSTALAVIVAASVSPWFLLGLIGNLRSIVAVRFVGVADGMPTISKNLLDIFWGQGLWLAIVALVAAIFVARSRTYRALAILAATLFLTAFRPTGYGLQHQGPAILVLVMFAGIAMKVLEKQQTISIAIAIIALLVPIGQSIAMIADNHRKFVDADPTAWLEQHVPPGTRVYWWPCLSKLPLPTRESSAALWNDLADPDAWRKKFAWGSSRLKFATPDDPPRALSDDLMEKDRGQHRCWFILGSRLNDPRPRFDIRLLGGSPISGEHAPLAKIAQRGNAIFVIRGQPAPELGEPIMSWINSQGDGTFIYRAGSFQLIP